MSLRAITQQHRSQLWDDARAFIAEHYDEQLEIDHVASGVFTSRRQLQRVFSENGGTTFREHLCRVRMEAAARMLVESRLPVRVIAGRVGYRQPAQFAKAFRRHAGVTPGEYRVRVREARATPDGRLALVA